MQMSDQVLSNIDYEHNRILIDWFSFSSRIDSFDTMVRLIGMEHCTWEILPGVRGYSCRYYFDGISIHYAGNNCFRYPGSDKEEVVKGAWLEMSGAGCRAFETHTRISGDNKAKWQVLFDYVVDHVDNVTVNRLDLAYDDFLGFLDIDKIVSDTISHNFISKFRSDPEIIISVGDEELAYTVTHGRMKSDVFIRIYDKRIEQNAQQFTDHWIRSEIQLRHGNSLSAIQLLTAEYEEHGAVRKFIRDPKPIDEVYFLIMNNYLRYVEPNEGDSNKWRWSMAEHWKKFAESVTEYSVSLWSKPDGDYTVLNLDRFVVDMAGGAIFTWVSLFGVDNLLEVCRSRASSLNPKYRHLLAAESVDDPDDAVFDMVLNNLTDNPNDPIFYGRTASPDSNLLGGCSNV